MSLPHHGLAVFGFNDALADMTFAHRLRKHKADMASQDQVFDSCQTFVKSGLLLRTEPTLLTTSSKDFASSFCPMVLSSSFWHFHAGQAFQNLLTYAKTNNLCKLFTSKCDVF